MIHKMEKEPKRGIPARPAKVNAAEDIIERVVSIFDMYRIRRIFFSFFFFLSSYENSKRFVPSFLSFQKSPAFSIADDRSTRSVSH